MERGWSRPTPSSSAISTLVSSAHGDSRPGGDLDGGPTDELGVGKTLRGHQRRGEAVGL